MFGVDLFKVRGEGGGTDGGVSSRLLGFNEGFWGLFELSGNYVLESCTLYPIPGSQRWCEGPHGSRSVWLGSCFEDDDRPTFQKE